MMKLDINLITQPKLKEIPKILIFFIIITVIILFFVFILPIIYKNSLIVEAEKMNQEIASINRVNSEYINLEKQLTNLLKWKEINNELEIRNRDFYKILEIIDDSMSSDIELTHISISGNILNLQGSAPNDKIIAKCIIRLQENQEILSVNIQEIYLNKDRLNRNFNISCLTRLTAPNIYYDSIEEGDIIEDYN